MSGPGSAEHPVYWCTRDQLPDGSLSDMVDVWLLQPTFVRQDDGSIRWEGPENSGLQHRYAAWSLAVTQANIYTVPETYRQCLRVG